jgi:hypothetical protein
MTTPKTCSRRNFLGTTVVATIAASFLGLSVILSALVAGAQRAQPEPTGWHNLFAANLSDAICPPDVWSWQDGVLSPKDKDEAIWSRQEYENFLLDLEFKLEPGANSGVFVYCTNIVNWITNHVEIQILDDAAPKWTNVPPTWKCAGIFGHASPMNAMVKSPGEWNHLAIRCVGPRISVWLNGALVTDINMKDWKSGTKNPDGTDIPAFEPRPLANMPTKGRIGLQGAHGGIPTHFRNLRIKLLNPHAEKEQ